MTKDDEAKDVDKLTDTDWNELFAEFDADIANIVQQAQVRPITLAEVDYLLRQYAFLEICNAEATDLSLVESPVIITAKSGWKIHQHNNHLIASPGRWLFGPYKDEDDASGGASLVGAGTIVRQIVETADSMIELAIKQWPAARIMDGYSLMKFAAWVAAEQRNYKLLDYTPTQEQQVTFSHILKIKAKEKPGAEPEPFERPR